MALAVAELQAPIPPVAGSEKAGAGKTGRAFVHMRGLLHWGE